MKIITQIINWFKGTTTPVVLDNNSGTLAPAEPASKPRKRSETLKLDYAVTERGAWLGRPTEVPRDPETKEFLYTGWKLHLVQVPRDEDGYDQGGAYWGLSQTQRLWCAWSDNPSRVRVWVWAATREEAKLEIAKDLKMVCKFYR